MTVRLLRRIFRRRRVHTLIYLALFLFTMYTYHSLVQLIKEIPNMKGVTNPYKARGKTWVTVKLRSNKSQNINGKNTTQAFNFEPKQRYIDKGTRDTILLNRQGIRNISVKSLHGVWPNAQFPSHDRILAQMSYVPQAVLQERNKPPQKRRIKTVVFWNGFEDINEGYSRLVEDNCPVTECYFTRRRPSYKVADAVVFSTFVPRLEKPIGQIWVYKSLESPVYTGYLAHVHRLINWTATYRRDSVLVTPYEKFVSFNSSNQATKEVIRNYAEGKTKLVAWFVSNCNARNDRGEIGRELSSHIKIDVFGQCGSQKCAKGRKECSNMINKDYKFYLSFENSNCRDYITEKLFWNALQHDVIPIVYGAKRTDYEAVAPPNSFIHVDDFPNLSVLADHLKRLDKDDNLYNEYFKWKGKGKFINTHFFCRLCALLWDESVNIWYDDVNKWWNGDDICLPSKHRSWRHLVI